MKICVTGHRPSKLFGYNLSDPRWMHLKETFKILLMQNDCTEAITGMALGVDTVFALAVLELRDMGYPIHLHCAIPCRGQDSRWPWSSKKQYRDILNQADVVTMVSNEPYSPYLMQKRNEYMVDLSDKVIAVWNGLPGGTANCIQYAKDTGKEIVFVNI